MPWLCYVIMVRPRSDRDLTAVRPRSGRSLNPLLVAAMPSGVRSYLATPHVVALAVLLPIFLLGMRNAEVTGRTGNHGLTHVAVSILLT